MKTKPKDITAFLMDKLGAGFMTLAADMGETQTQITQWLKRPERMNLAAIKRLATLVYPEDQTWKAYELVRDYKCGLAKITHGEALALSDIHAHYSVSSKQPQVELAPGSA